MSEQPAKTAPERITAENPPQWAVEAQNEICAVLGFNWEGDTSLAAIIAKHAPQPAPAVPVETPSDKEMLNLLRKGCTLWELAGNGGWELTTKAGDFKGATLDDAIAAAMRGEREGT